MASLRINIEDGKLPDSDDMSCLYKLINEKLSDTGLSKTKRQALRMLGGKMWALDNALHMAKMRCEDMRIPVLNTPVGMIDPDRIEFRADGTVAIKAPQR